MTQTIAYFRSGIGNFVQSTPAARALAMMDPSGKIDFCYDGDWRDTRRNSVLSAMQKLDFVENLIPFPRCIPTKFDRDYKTWFWTDWTCNGDALEFFRKRHHYRHEWDHEKESESDYYFNIVKNFYGFKGEKPKQSFPISDKPFEFTAGRKNIVICNGGFGGYSIIKKWNRFWELALVMKNYYGNAVNIIKIGQEKELQETFNYDYDFVGKTTILETARIISQADLLITTDTGNMHIADALNVPMIVLWGGTSLFKNRPINDTAKIIHLRKSCQYLCHASSRYRECDTLACMNDISTGMVFREVKEFFKGKI